MFTSKRPISITTKPKVVSIDNASSRTISMFGKEKPSYASTPIRNRTLCGSGQFQRPRTSQPQQKVSNNLKRQNLYNFKQGQKRVAKDFKLSADSRLNPPNYKKYNEKHQVEDLYSSFDSKLSAPAKDMKNKEETPKTRSTIYLINPNK